MTKKKQREIERENRREGNKCNKMKKIKRDLKFANILCY